MHYLAEVWIPEADDAEKQLGVIMAPYEETWNEEQDRYIGWWDWYQIGGRWKGQHVAGYDRETDPANFEAGGEKLAWPTRWPAHPQDIIKAKDVLDDLGCHTLVVRGKVFHTEEWTGKELIKTGFDGKVRAQLDRLGITEGYLVTVDYHD